ncbi:head-tail joining protein [Ralstonia pseudosolanacearum]
MGIVEALYEAAANAGLLKQCIWRPSDGSPPQTPMVGFATPDETLLDGLTVSTEYVMSYPATVLVGLGSRETVEIGGARFHVRDVRAVGDGSEIRAKLSRL